MQGKWDSILLNEASKDSAESRLNWGFAWRDWMEWLWEDEGVGKHVIGEEARSITAESGSKGSMLSRNCTWLSRKASKFSSTSGRDCTSNSMVKVLDGRLAGGGWDCASSGLIIKSGLLSTLILDYQSRHTTFFFFGAFVGLFVICILSWFQDI